MSERVTPPASPEGDRLARVALALVAEPGHPELLRQVRRLGAVEVRDRLLRDRDFGPRMAAVDPDRELAAATHRGLRFVVPGDDEWPGGLDDLALAPPLQEQGEVPIGLWVRGPLRLDRLAGALAVVGSREGTTYGGEIAREIAATASRAGRVVVSGAAVGIDQAAHRGAIAVDGPTVAVLACGADRVYPPGAADLLGYLAAEGAIVSETVPAGAPMRNRFLSRNRIIAALTVGTVVVEAAARSGALSTANWAIRLNRHLMGVPGPVTSPVSCGVHELIRAGAATLTGSGAEVLEVLGVAGEDLAPVPRGPVRSQDLLSHPQRQVLDAVPLARGATEASIARTAALGVAEARALLSELHRHGLVELAGDGWRLTPRAMR